MLNLFDLGDEESSLIIAYVSQDKQAILGHPFAQNHRMSSSLIVSCDSCLACSILVFVSVGR